MRKSFIIMLIAACLLFMLAGCSQTDAGSSDQLKQYSADTFSFDTVITLKAYCTSQDEFDRYFNMAVEQFNHYYKLFDRYHTYANLNNLKTVNDNAGVGAVDVDAALIEVVRMASDYYVYTAGGFDCTIGRLIDIWADFRSQVSADAASAVLPAQTVLKNAYVADSWNYVTIDEAGNKLTITDSRIQLDLGAIAKGYASQKVADYLNAEGLNYGFISAGGNVVLLGLKPDGSSWNVGIANPQATSSSLDIITASQKESLVTSGSYQRTVTYNGENYHHVIDPKTLQPARLYTSVTVIGADSTLCDVLSTALFVLPLDEGQALLETYAAGYDAVWVQDSQQADTSRSGYWASGYWLIPTDHIRSALSSLS